MKKSSENIAGFFHWTTQPNLLSINYIYSSSCVYSVKLKNLKANHNLGDVLNVFITLCIFRKVKKSESKSQRIGQQHNQRNCCVYSVKLKNLKANHNEMIFPLQYVIVVYIP